MAAIDRVLPEWDVHGVHAVERPCTPERALEAVLALPAAPDRVVRRMAIDFRAEPIPGGSRLSTETRVRAVDRDARRRFRRYWRLVGPFSALVRRRRLAAVRRSVDAA